MDPHGKVLKDSWLRKTSTQQMSAIIIAVIAIIIIIVILKHASDSQELKTQMTL